MAIQRHIPRPQTVQKTGDTSRVLNVPAIREQQVPTIQRNRFLFKYHVEFVDEIMQVLQATQRQVPVVQTVQTTVEIPQRQLVQVIVEVVDVRQSMPVIMQRRDDQTEASSSGSSCTEKTVEFPQMQFVELSAHSQCRIS